MRASQFTGGFGGNRNSNVLNPSQGQDPFEKSTPAPKPGNASRAGITFSGSVAGALPRSSNFDSAFDSINLSGGSNRGREVFQRMGERSANQDVRLHNTNATAANEAATVAKQSEIANYNSTVSNLNNQYANSVNQYNTTVNQYNKTKSSVNSVNSLADAVNAKATIYRNTGTDAAKTDYEAAMQQYNTAKNSLANNQHLKGVDGLFDDGGLKVQYDNAVTYGWDYYKKPTYEGVGYNSYNFGNGVSGVWHGGVSVEHRDKLASTDKQYNRQGNDGYYYGADLYDAYNSAGGPNFKSSSIYSSKPSFNSQYGYYNQPAYNPWSGEVFQAKQRISRVAEGKKAANVPYAFGQYDSSVDQYKNWYNPPASAPSRPNLPDAPDAFVELQQMKEMLPDAPDRRLVSGQREITGGSLPPQVADTTGDTFTQLNVTQGSTPYREISQLNQAEQQRLGAPKGYRTPTGVTITPDMITNTSTYKGETKYYIYRPGVLTSGWILASQLTPLY